MKRHWIKFIYERNIYVVDLCRIKSFVVTKNGRLMFGLPDTKDKVQIILHHKSNPEVYQEVLEYIEKLNR